MLHADQNKDKQYYTGHTTAENSNMEQEIKKRKIHQVKDWYEQFEKPISSFSLIAGFAFNILTLKRVDMFWENFWIIIHLLVVAVTIILLHAKSHEDTDWKDSSKLHFWLITILQFTFGGLLSTFLVFYFRSASLSASWPFFLLLAGAFIANERLKHYYSKIAFQLGFFFLSLFLFAIYIVPVIVHSLGDEIFVVSGVSSLVLMIIYLQAFKFTNKEKFYESRPVVLASILGTFLFINILYFTNIIPPIPLSLKDAGIYHSITKNGTGDYVVKTEKKNLLDYLRFTDQIHVREGSTIYAFNAIFSPSSLNINVIHRWEKYDESAKSWVSMGDVTLGIVGGREGGYRTYSIEDGITAGKWRITVLSEQDQVIGRIRFDVITDSAIPTLINEVKN